MRVLLVSDAPWAVSGYAVQAAMIGPILRDQGHAVAYVAAFGLHGAPQPWNGFTVFPGGLDGFGNDAIAPAVQQFQPDIVITLKDLWVYQPQSWRVPIRWCPMVPVDHDPIPEPIVGMLRQHAYEPIAYAEFGLEQLRTAGFSPAYAPHGFDPAVFYPDDRAACRQALGMADDTLAVGMVAVNRGGDPSRKAWPQNLEGFAMALRMHPSLRLYLHTHAGVEGREGAMNLPQYCAQLGITPYVHFIDQTAYDRGMPPEYLRQFYTAMDMVNTISVGEGFGIPTLEAQACGTPVLVGDWCASAELLFAGVAVDKQDALRYYDRQTSYIYLPQPRAIAAALDTLARRLPTERAALQRRAVTGAMRYTVARVAEDWTATMAHIQARMHQEHERGILRIVEPKAVLV